MVQQRSPNYPGIELSEAVERVKQAYSTVGRGEFSNRDVTTAWGYNSVSGPMRVRVAALRQYGFLERVGDGTSRLTTRALTIALRNQASNEYREALRDAALSPVLFAEMFETGRFQNAPDALRQYLVVEKRFTDKGATRFASILKATFDLAGIGDGDSMSGQIQGEFDQLEIEDDSMSTPTTSQPTPSQPTTRSPVVAAETVPADTRVYRWSLAGNREAELRVPGSLSERDIDILRKYLDVTEFSLQVVVDESQALDPPTGYEDEEDDF